MKIAKTVVTKGLVVLSILGLLSFSVPNLAMANTDPPTTGKVTGKTVGAGLLSLLIWPGIGQAVNNNKGNKVATHAIIGLFPLTRFWSGYDALVNRQGGYWDGKI
jgi:hypothetical protein